MIRDFFRQLKIGHINAHITQIKWAASDLEINFQIKFVEKMIYVCAISSNRIHLNLYWKKI